MSVSTSTGTSNKRASRSNSISSSVVTIKKSASVSSRTNPRTSYLPNRSASPDSVSRVLNTLNNSRPELRGRADILQGKKAATGLGVNRWSHSTSSSLSAIDADLITRRTSSLRKSSGYTPNTLRSSSQTRNSLDQTSDNKNSSKRSSSTSNGTSSRAGSRLAFRDSSNLNVVQGVPQQSKSHATSRLNQSTWEQSSSVNKFGDTVQSLSIHYTAVTASNDQLPSPSLSGAEQNTTLDERHRTLQNQNKELSDIRAREPTNFSRQPISNHLPQGARSRREVHNVDTRSPRRRDMLSRALAKANEAVLLDNAQNINAAIEAYNEACELLQQVMLRSADLADRRKLSSIKATYSRRIAELHDFDTTFEGLMGPLPDDPPVEEYENPEDFYQEDALYQHTVVNTAPAIQLPLRQESLLPEIFGGENYIHDRALPAVPNPISSSQLNIPMDEQYMPAPLSPRPLFGHQPDQQPVTPSEDQFVEQDSQNERSSGEPGPSTWLAQSDGASSKSSSRLSSMDYGKKDGQLMSAIEAEFDAMNAAVDSAYDVLDQETTPRNAAKALQANERNRYDYLTGTYLDDDAEDEEQLLESMTRDADVDEDHPGMEGMSALPRQSDSSGFSGRTWGSSMASTTATNRTTLSTLAENIEPPLHAPPTTALPQLPRASTKIPDVEVLSSANKSASTEKHVGIRDRRMSAQSATQLKIETFARRNSFAQQAKLPQTTPLGASAGGEGESVQATPAKTLAPAASFTSSVSTAQSSTPLHSVHSDDATFDGAPSTPALTQTGSVDDAVMLGASPARHGKMMPPPSGPLPRKNLSSSHLGKASLSINTGHLEAESPMTPGSAMFPHDARKPQSAVSSAVSIPATNPVLTSIGLGGMHLLEDYIGDPRSPRSADQMVSEPVPLEPCPDSFLLRPFWLMRCLYQAFAHPKGGYVSTKLFIPRDIWRVRNVKLKALDDKVAQCDLLTAALRKLARVDTLDANAVLEELQSFETILDQVRLALSKKLGSDVGLSGSFSVFKASPGADDAVEMLPSKSANTSSAAKSIASGWRKLRSKSSSANLSSSARGDNVAHNVTMASLPMTSSSSVATSRSYSNARNQNPPPTPSNFPQLLAPHANYISALARLFDAVQILDSIARQAEDPGLKCSSQTHVGLELSVRNAAEFFSFYIVRFVMSDIYTLLDKYLKRGGEWVMS